MTATTYADLPDEPDVLNASAEAADRASRRWRAIWRTHFYAGAFSAPFLVLMAVTGLVILYTQPIRDLTQAGVRTVSDTGDWVSFDQQELAVEDAYPDASVVSMTMPSDGAASTTFGLDNGRDVFVDPYTAEVLGDEDPGGGIVGLSNRLHGFLNNDSLEVSLPSVSALWDDEPVMRTYVVGDVMLEILGGWGIVLAVSGLYLWWPRKAQVERERSGRRRFSIRLTKQGRAKWRDLHAVPGVVLCGLLLFVLVSGMPWSSYWGANFTSLANEISPNTWTDAPTSGLATRSDLDRLGNQINWNTGDIPIPTSYATPIDGTVAAPIALDAVFAIGEQEGMKPGYTIFFPSNSTDDAGNPLYGSFTLSNSWPRKTGEARDLFLDQFTGATLAEQDVYGYGVVSYATDVTVSVHMGTQFGIVTRILMTLLCVLTLWSVVTASVMYWKRRRPGTAGLPRRPREVRLANRLIVIVAVLAIVYPLWGVTAALILFLDKFVIRKVTRLRVAFGQH
ncbi:MAG: putative iron-regulated membrane protein [Acidimicrobiaceae bacterium]|nr:MAG: putative iron-regulated membrane protein [Acidimicrobiaceae bacterium]